MSIDKNKVKQTLETERDQIKAQIIDLKKGDPFNDPDHASDNAAVDTDIREQGGHDLIEAEVETLQTRVENIEEALERLEKGQYGYCAKCGTAIAPARLELVPEAKYCVPCESGAKR